MLFGGEVRPTHKNPNQPGDICKFDDESLRLLIEEGRTQAERQTDRFRHATDRAQILLTVDIALLGFMAALLHHLLQLSGGRETACIILWAISSAIAIFATVAAAAVVVVSARFSGIDTTIVSNMSPPILMKLARDYASSVRSGELTADLRVTVFQQTTRITVWATLIAALAFGISA
jgi:hypothetical protein